ncbi:PAAR domain-containing protein [Burkholderia thailandensis]|uniref:PAAR domain-containing protein n=1 Tax=Burkholderia thailandensis TaxID=57975 RepID=UPI00030E2D28|nr:PAAR domain-containing protein [Burkholderia thailandensis]MCS3395415.1 PAAR domain-containing protein [Burkholderia thailandensis]MCS6424095.1 PAAR domain-containing protein [Burkholderia thailandensis]MCS6456779.1 PAAR domain-containing protein [Burkholderia thailandensis]MCS6464253.1 PAAR domain-containing protein [Burkholderia thailandensis]MCS6482020.1 PAAR domain-containing protein [Burkholderia thailandensis]
MGFAFICEGDTTTHGGRVIGCNTANTVHGKAIALLGDMVTCPRCGGIFPIVSVKRELNMTFGDRPIATDGDKTACGATLIASQGTATVAPSAGQGSPIGGGRRVIPQISSVAQGNPERGRFQVLDDGTGQPIPNHPYAVKAADGRTITGRTDENGFTDWLETHSASSLTFDHPGTSAA